jgi:hypothetical protein
MTIAAPRPVVAASEARFLDTSATSTFQRGITFNLVAEADSPIESVELYWHPVGESEQQAAFPDVTVGTHVEVSYDVDTTVIYLPPGIDIAYRWRVIEQAGDISESPEQTLFYMDDGPDWRQRTNGLVTVYWYSGDDAFGQQIADTAVRAIDRLSSRFQVNATEPVRIVIYGDDNNFTDALPPNSAEWIGGQAHPELNLIVAMLDPDGSADREIKRMVPHEISHLILYQATRNPFNTPPGWLDEGLAVYNQEVEDSRFRGILNKAVDNGQLIPVRALKSGFPLDPDQALLSYAESWSIVRYIIEDLGDEQLASMVAAYRREVSFDESVQQSLGMSIDELDARWKASLGYKGDRGPQALDNTSSAPNSDNSDLTRNELIFLISFSGVIALIGLAVLIFSIINIRRIGRQQRLQ